MKASKARPAFILLLAVLGRYSSASAAAVHEMKKKQNGNVDDSTTKAEGCTLCLVPTTTAPAATSLPARLPCHAFLPFHHRANVVVVHYLNGLSKGHSPRPFASRRSAFGGRKQVVRLRCRCRKAGWSILQVYRMNEYKIFQHSQFI